MSFYFPARGGFAYFWVEGVSRWGGSLGDKGADYTRLNHGVFEPGGEVQVYQVRSLDRPLFIVFVHNSEGIIGTSRAREQGMMECDVSPSLFSVYAIKKRVH